MTKDRTRQDGEERDIQFDPVGSAIIGPIIERHDRNDTIIGGIKDDELYGLGGDDLILGGSGNDYLDGGEGADTMYGGKDNDIYVVDNTGDKVIENTNEGNDTVLSSITYTLGNNVENLTLTGDQAIDGYGNNLNNVLIGNSANNLLYGDEGNDTLFGNEGNDFLYGGEGSDSLCGGDGSDSLYGGAGSDFLYGGEGNDFLYGATGNDTLDGGEGADTMRGGYENDTYIINNTNDKVIEYSNQGNDTVESSVTYTLSDNVENLTLTGTDAIDGTGNDLDNVITGNNADNVLSGGKGNDWLYGDDGNDSLYGDDGNDSLYGGEGADTMYGGIGNDIYVVDNEGDVVKENIDEGADLVYSSVTYTLSDNIEKLFLIGFNAIDGTGNDLDNVLVGNNTENTLDGKAGNDWLTGGNGDDYLDGGEGNDTLDGGRDDDIVYGNNGNDYLFGGDGSDTLDGGAGNDTLYGGAGSDTYGFSLGDGSDIINDTGSDGSRDTISFDAYVSRNTIAFFEDGTSLHIAYEDRDYITVLDQDTTGIEKIQLSDGFFLTDSDINKIIQDLTSYANDHGISLTSVDDVKGNQELMNMIVNAWHQ